MNHLNSYKRAAAAEMARPWAEPMVDPQRIKSFALAGNALFTLKSLKTGEHYTFKVQGVEPQAGTPPTHWNVSVLAGRDNNHDYRWIGRITAGGGGGSQPQPQPFQFQYRTDGKNRPSIEAFNWFWQMLNRGTPERFVEQCQFRHAGRCGRCGRLLTHPESIQSGIGPECQDKMAFEALGGAEGLLDQLFGG